MCFSVLGIDSPQLLKEHFLAEFEGDEFVVSKALAESCPELVKFPESDQRIYPGYMTYVVRSQNNKKLITPMRYRVRPHHSLEEVPSKFNVFNARLDKLDQRKTWQGILNNRGIFMFKAFYEWVTYENTKQLVRFFPKDQDYIIAPVLWDHWENPKNKKESFYSFAIITDDPNEEVERAGHDRSPIYLQEGFIDSWLEGKNQSIGEMRHILSQRTKTYYQYELDSIPKKKKRTTQKEDDQLKLF